MNKKVQKLEKEINEKMKSPTLISIQEMGDIDIDEIPLTHSLICELHNCQLLYDMTNKKHYCPDCELNWHIENGVAE